MPVVGRALEGALHEHEGALLLVALQQHAGQKRADGAVDGEVRGTGLQELLAPLARIVQLAETVLHGGEVERVEHELMRRGIDARARLGLQVDLLRLRHVSHALVRLAERLVDHAHERGLYLVAAAQKLVALRDGHPAIAGHGRALHGEALGRELHDARIEAALVLRVPHAALEAPDPHLSVRHARVRDGGPRRQHAHERRVDERGRGDAAQPQQRASGPVGARERAGSFGEVGHVGEIAG